MRTYNVLLKAYKLDELAEDAQQRAYKDWKERPHRYHDMDESAIASTITNFGDLFDIDCVNWGLDADGYNYQFDITNETLQGTFFDHGTLCNRGLAEYLMTNYSRYMPLKYDPTDCQMYPTSEFRYSKDFLRPMQDCMNGVKKYGCYHDVVSECLDALLSCAQSTCIYRLSYDYFREVSILQECLYFEDGTPFSLPHLFAFPLDPK